MTTILDVPVTSEAAPALTAPESLEVQALRSDLEQRSFRRDNWTIMMFGVAVVALLFSMMAVGFGVRAVSDSKHVSSTAAPIPTGAPPASATLTSVTLGDMKVTPSATTVAAGTYTVAITNAGAMPHELLVFHTDIAATDLPVGPDGKVGEDAPGFQISDGENLDPGASQSRVIDLTHPGTYLFVCNLPGHLMAGMHTTVTVK
jgi:uncharacterized cupredoxin-like copper-binding protein